MGYVYAEIQLTNEDDLAVNRRGWLAENEIKRVTCKALVDSGAWDLVINQEVQKRLNLPILGRGTVEMADETLLEVDIVGPVEVRFEDHATTVRAVVIPNASEVLLGAFPLEGLDAFIDPKRERLVVNPEDVRPVKRVA
jgi:clan AA aspartic protease